MDLVYRDFLTKFEEAMPARMDGDRRIGAELKFPLVGENGSAAPYETVRALWKHLFNLGWKVEYDPATEEVIGARKPGDRNDTVASCETGFCKVEFSLAHVGNLFDLDRMIGSLRDEIRPFCERQRVRLLGCGVHPVTRPGRDLLMRKSRAGVWNRIHSGNRCVPPEDGTDLHLFTINTASHCHLNVARDEAIPLVNVLNGFAGAQIALTANSSVWRGEVDANYRCVAEKFWDWWMPDADRVGVPALCFSDLRDYVRSISSLKPVFVRRKGQPIILEDYESFSDFYQAGRVRGINMDGLEVSFVPAPDDLDLHNTCYWYNARISRHYTVENRANDQQPPDALPAVAALTLGLASSLEEALEELRQHDWQTLRDARGAACRAALHGRAGHLYVADLAARMLDIARIGLCRRGLGEETFLEPLFRRLKVKRCPADGAAELFEFGGAQALLSG
ncbi:MAG TPA: glutamate-cysteine ligase family protein, partial [Sumerlaeia bacterium]|nr:glutamate-cysteine ligase family protein [Sumerlaeia bacterium]